MLPGAEDGTIESPPDLGDVADRGRRCVPDGVGPRRGHAHPDHRRLGPRRGVRAGRVRASPRTLAASTACLDNPGAWLTTVGRATVPSIGCATSQAVDAKTRRSPCACGDDAHGRTTTPSTTIAAADLHVLSPGAAARGAQVALTLRTLAGLTTREIARAFLVADDTMAKRLVRAKAKIQHAGIPYRVPPPELLAERTSGVLAVLYLLFNEGYTASSGDELVRQSLCDEAMRLAGALVELMPNEHRSGRAAGIDGAAQRSSGRTSRRARRLDSARGAGPLDVGSRRDSWGDRAARSRRTARGARPVPTASGDRGVPRDRARRRRHGLGAHRNAVRPTRRHGADRPSCA